MKRVMGPALVLALMTTSVSLADDPRDTRRDEYRWSSEHRDSGHRYDQRNDRHWKSERYRNGEYRGPHGYRDHHWRRGDRLPKAYYGRPYVLSNYRHYRLHPPPRGYHWVRVNRDAVLAVIATGIVLDVMHNHFW